MVNRPSFLLIFPALAAIASSERIFGIGDAKIPSRLGKSASHEHERDFYRCRSHVTRFVRACTGGAQSVYTQGSMG